MSTELVMFEGLQLPTEFNAEMYAASKALTGGLGSSVNKLSIKGSVFRLNIAGNETQVLEQPSLDVVIIAASPHVARTYYKGAFNADSKDKPSCYSQDGVSPSNGSTEKQSEKCVSCAQNQLGSGKPVGGKQTRACSFKKRIVVAAPDAVDGDVFAFDVNALSLFGTGQKENQKFTLSEYGKWLAQPRGASLPHGVPPAAMITTISFDRSASVPKAFFSPKGFMTNDLIKAALTRAKADDVVLMLTDISEGLVPDPDDVFQQPAPASAKNDVKAIEVKAPVAEAPKEPAKPTPAKTAGGFGAQATVTPTKPVDGPKTGVAPTGTASIASQLANFDD